MLGVGSNRTKFVKESKQDGDRRIKRIGLQVALGGEPALSMV